MTSEHGTDLPPGFRDEMPEEPKDRTRWIWLGVLVLVAAMLAILWVRGRISYAGLSVVRARHLLIQFDDSDPADRAAAFELIQELRERIESGESFSKLAKEYSADSYSAPRGGDLGYMAKGTFEETFEKYVWEAPLNELSDVITTTHGFHLVMVLDRRLCEADKYNQRIIDETLKRKETPPDSPEAPAPSEDIPPPQ
ncbi:MAG TPA: peptidylprolyl isomerase [Candidatus Hydrogenedentes bacterium]|nr:peptidylprolyl isomerase [Candidatus Hydrogenedentota bacterium]HPG66352.1 peptidylprolyl isomerase [Candidatus Hydrogenedentota bacterium]